MTAVAEALDLGDVEIAIFPNTLLASFTSVDRDRSRPLPPTWPPGHHVHFRDEPDDEAEQLLARRASENRNTIMATFDSRSDLTKLEAVVALSRRVIDGALTVEEAEFLLAEIDHVKRHGFWDVVDAFVAYPTFAAVASIVFFGGNWLSFLLSVPPAVLISLVGHSPLTAPLISRDLSKLVPFIAGFISAFSARMSAYLFRDQCYPTLVLAPIARLLPGTEVLLAFVEIATGDMVTGTSRLGAAAVNILLIAFGTILGSDLAYWVPRRRGRCEPTGNPGFAGVLALLAALAEIVMNRGEGMSVKVWFWITIAAGVGYAVYYLASTTAEYGRFSWWMETSLRLIIFDHQPPPPSVDRSLSGCWVICTPGSTSCLLPLLQFELEFLLLDRGHSLFAGCLAFLARVETSMHRSCCWR